MQQLINQSINRHIKLAQSFDQQDIEQIESLIKKAIDTLKQGCCLFFAGNGGSFADAQHITAELVIRYKKNRSAYRAICLGANSSNLTACANDFSYESIFSRELEALGKKGDLVIAFSTSGNSKNILNLLDLAKSKGIDTFALSGQTGGKLAQKCEHIIIKSDEVARIQEMHILIGHILCEAIDSSIH